MESCNICLLVTNISLKHNILNVHCVCMLSHVWLFATPWTVARQAPLSMGFSRREYWSGYVCVCVQCYYKIMAVLPCAMQYVRVVYFWPILSWILYMVWGKDPTSLFCVWLFTFYSAIYWEDCPFLIEWSWHSCQKSFNHLCKGLFLGSLFYSLSLYVYFCMIIT